MPKRGGDAFCSLGRLGVTSGQGSVVILDSKAVNVTVGSKPRVMRDTKTMPSSGWRRGRKGELTPSAQSFKDNSGNGELSLCFPNASKVLQDTS